MSASYPVRVDAHLDSELSRWRWLVKWVLIIPHYLVLAFLWVAFAVLSAVAFCTILVTGRYPRAIFEFNVGVLRWSWRVAYYAYGALGTDRYPPFTLGERANYPAHLAVIYPERLSRGLVLVKWWLLAIPHYLVVGVFLGGAGVAVERDAGSLGAIGLIGLLVLVAAVVLLVTGRYPQSVFDLVLGLNRWVLRVAAYAALMTDAYPPFRLDQGGADPDNGEVMVSPTPEVPGAVQPSGGSGTPSPLARSREPGWSTGRVVAVVVTSVAAVVAAALIVAGASLAIAGGAMRDGSGFLTTGQQRLSTSSYALTSKITGLQHHQTGWTMPMMSRHWSPSGMMGRTRIDVQSTHKPAFIGIARPSDVKAYLHGVRHATLLRLGHEPAYRTTGTRAPSAIPVREDFWISRDSGTGRLSVEWPRQRGPWTLVVMNSDASPGVSIRASAAATVPTLGWASAASLTIGGFGLVVTTLLLVLVIRAASRR
jgi:sulfite exporter TauE/SafE